jgi:hypothetical protein
MIKRQALAGITLLALATCGARECATARSPCEQPALGRRPAAGLHLTKASLE